MEPVSLPSAGHSEGPVQSPILGLPIDDRDVGTPDDWVPRHKDLIRLTGRHPFNAEPPPDVLLDKGFITPTDLHYVRCVESACASTWSLERSSPNVGSTWQVPEA
jgi:hypothetical protein